MDVQAYRTPKHHLLDVITDRYSRNLSFKPKSKERQIKKRLNCSGFLLLMDVKKWISGEFP